MTSWKPRLIDPDELRAVVDLTAVAFGVGPVGPPDYAAQVSAPAEVDRTFVVDDGDTVAGTGGAFTFDLALPGGATVAMAAVTEVSVLPSHRRRGILRVLMDALVDQALERGEPVAGLTASEGVIYRRFGYGVGARFQTVTVDPARSAELVSPAAPGRVRLATPAEASPAGLAAVWDRTWRRAPGELSRSPGWWEGHAVDPEVQRDGASARYAVVHEDPSGEVDGFATYRIAQSWGPDERGHELRVEDVAGVDDAVDAALLRFLLDVDLVANLRWLAAPLDLPLRWRLVDSRALRVRTEHDHLWLRPLDVAACLAARSYAAEGGFTVEVVDAARPELGGTFRLDAGPGGAACDRTTAEPDLVLAAADLGAALLGGVSWTTLRRAGLVQERTAGAAATADALFRPERAPYCGTDF